MAATVTAEATAPAPEPQASEKALAKRDKKVNGKGHPVDPPQPQSPLAIFDRLASIPGQDIEKLSKLLDLDRDWRAEQARVMAAAAFTRCEGAMEEVLKNAVNQHTKTRFAQLEAIHRKIKPVYTGEGFSVTFGEADCSKEGHMRITADLQHASGWTKTYRLDLPIDGTGAQGGRSSMNPLQARGSTITYGRRYLECMIFNVTIAGEDVDGNNPILDPVSAEQIAEVVKLFKRVKTVTPLDWERFLRMLDVKQLDELTQEGYRTAIGDLNARLAAAGAEAAIKAPGPEGEK